MRPATSTASRTPFLVVFSVLALLLVGLAGCDKKSPTDPDTILTLAGTCRATATSRQIVCEDRSKTEPKDRIKSITFTALDDDGLTVETRTASANQAAPRQVIFSGLKPGTYQVEHVVEADDGGESRTVYRDITVF